MPLPNYHSDIVEKAQKEIESKSLTIAELDALSKTHQERIDAYKKAQELNSDLIAIHLQANDAIRQALSKYSHKEAEVTATNGQPAKK